MRHGTHSKQDWLPPLLIESVVAEEACGVGGKELSLLPQNLPPRKTSSPIHARAPLVGEVCCSGAEFCSTAEKRCGCSNSD